MTNKEFWKDIIYKDGKIDEEQVFKELEDYRFLMDNASEVYDEVTGGILSKTNYLAKTIIQEFEDKNYNKRITQDDVKQIIEETKTRKDLIDELVEYFDIEYDK